MKDIISRPEDSLRLDALLHEVHKILGNPNFKIESDTKIDEALEKIILLRNNKDKIQQVFDSVWEVSSGMIVGDFSKRIKLSPELKKENNILNFIATSWNTTNEELGQRLITQDLGNNIIEQLSGNALVLVTDSNGCIVFINSKAEAIFNITSKKAIGQNISFLLPQLNASFVSKNDSEVKNKALVLPNNKAALLNVKHYTSHLNPAGQFVYTIIEKVKDNHLAAASITNKSLKKVKELEQLVEEYKVFQNFPLEQSSQLTSDETLVIQEFLIPSNESEKTETKDESIAKIYNEAVEKLNSSLTNYDNWILNKARELKNKDKKGVYKKYPEFPDNTLCNNTNEKELLNILRQYDNQWKAWINQSALFTAKEELSISYFLNYRSHQILANELGTSVNSINFSFNNAVKKLKFSLQRYNTWIMARALEISRQQSFENGSESIFLNTPLKEFKLPIKVTRVLETMSITTPLELSQQITLNSLYRLRGMGENSVQSVYNLFKQHKCAHLLKQE